MIDRLRTSVQQLDYAAEYRRARTIAVLIGLVTATVLLRNLILDSPLMAGDEYAYFAASQMFPDAALRYAGDPSLPKIYSPVFAGLGWIFFAVSDRPELLMKGLNTIGFALSTLIYLRLIARLGARGAAPVAAAVLLLLPISAYTAYFMPETTYVFLFALLIWSMVTVLPRRLLRGGAQAGAIVGTMLLVKPHAIAVFLAVLLTFGALSVAPETFRPGRRMLLAGAAIFTLSTYVALTGLNGILTGQLNLHPLLFVGDLYRSYLSEGAQLTSWLGKFRLLFGILCGHLILTGAILALPVTLGAALLHGLFLRPAAPEDASDPVDDRTLFVLISFAILVTIFAVGMTTNFTAQIGLILPPERIRMHGRYYSYVFPLYLIVYFAFSQASGRRPVSDVWIRTGAGVGCVLSALLLYLQAARIIYPWDFPEAFAFSAWHGVPKVGAAGIAAALLTYGGVAVAVTTYGVILWRGRITLWLYPVLLIIVFTLSNLGVTAWQRANSINSATLRADARAMKQLIPAAEQDQTLVVGSEWNGPLAYFMFNFRASARVLVRPAGTALADTDVPAGVSWVVTIDPYQLPLRATPVVHTAQVALLKVDAARSGAVASIAGPAR